MTYSAFINGLSEGVDRHRPQGARPTSPCTTKRLLRRSRSRPKPLWPERVRGKKEGGASRLPFLPDASTPSKGQRNFRWNEPAIASSPRRSRDFAACADPAALENAKAKYLGKAGALTDLLKGLGKLRPGRTPGRGRRDQRGQGSALEAALAARRAAPGRLEARCDNSPRMRSTSRCRGAASTPERCIRCRACPGARRVAVPLARLRPSPTDRRSRTTSTTSPRSTRRRTIRHGRCTTRSTSKAA